MVRDRASTTPSAIPAPLSSDKPHREIHGFRVRYVEGLQADFFGRLRREGVLKVCGEHGQPIFVAMLSQVPNRAPNWLLTSPGGTINGERIHHVEVPEQVATIEVLVDPEKDEALHINPAIVWKGKL